MQLSERWTYDQVNKRAVLPGKKFQCVMARGLFTRWKTPVYLGVDEPMTLETISNIITTLEEKGFKVWGITMDLGNQAFLSEVDFYDGQYFFQNPFDPTRRCYIIPDVPHCYKLFRNHLFDKGFFSQSTQTNQCQTSIQ